MAHQAEKTKKLVVFHKELAQGVRSLGSHATVRPDVLFVEFPPLRFQPSNVLAGQDPATAELLGKFASAVTRLAQALRPGGKLVLYGNAPTLCLIHPFVNSSLIYNVWIAVRTKVSADIMNNLPAEHNSLVIYTKGSSVLRHAKTRIAYEFCPACKRTTKDYGGKKHLYPSYGTLMSDVWKDFGVDSRDVNRSEVVDRVRDMFSIDGNEIMLVLDGSSTESWRKLPIEPLDLTSYCPPVQIPSGSSAKGRKAINARQSCLCNGDALELLARVPDGSIDLAFADPPYNLSKRYSNYRDNIDIQRYFEWCDKWLEEYVRVLKPGGSLVVLNLPLWSVRHFWYLCQRLTFQNWIAWEGLSLPVRLIMPAHYTLLFFTKGDSPNVFNYGNLATKFRRAERVRYDDLMQPYDYTYCSRPQCVALRRRAGKDTRRPLTDLWTDIFRLKHNTRRLNHPCLLSPKLMMRIIYLLTNPGDIVLDCFNGVGTTTLSAHVLGRRYMGFEISQEYHAVAVERHRMVEDGDDPFAKTTATPKVKNNAVPRVTVKQYEIPKRTLQLEIRRLAIELGHIPSREEVALMGRFDIRYYDQYFRNWSEAVAAARPTSILEQRITKEEPRPLTLFDRGRDLGD